MSFISRRQVSTGLAASLFAGAFHRAFAADEDLIAAARRERVGTLYGVIDPGLIRNALRRFEDEFNISVDYLRLTSAPLAQRFSSEVETNSNNADVVMLGDPLFFAKAKKSGWLASPNALPLAGQLQADAWDGTLATVALNPHSLAWNTNLVKDPPTDWKILIEPAWAGRVAIIDPRNGLPGLQWYVLLRKAYGDDFLVRLGKNAIVQGSAITGLQQLAAGGIALYAPLVRVSVAAMAAKGAPITDMVPEPNLPGAQWGAVNAKAPHPNVARLLLGFLMSKEGQSIVNENGFSAVPAVPGTIPMPRTESINPAEAQNQLQDVLRLIGIP